MRASKLAICPGSVKLSKTAVQREEFEKVINGLEENSVRKNSFEVPCGGQEAL